MKINELKIGIEMRIRDELDEINGIGMNEFRINEDKCDEIKWNEMQMNGNKWK